MNSVVFIISLLASVIGAICGIGGGVIVKPVMDALSIASVSTVNLLSSSMVLSMSLYSVACSLLSKDNTIETQKSTPIAFGAVLGGVAGNLLFSYMEGLVGNPNSVGAVQAGCLTIVTLGTLVYTLKHKRIKSRYVNNQAACICIGFGLGIMSSFLGIGGGPINLVVLYFFFSMDTKTAARNSLYIILFSQFANLAVMLISRSIPSIDMLLLLLMVAGGIGGGIIGRIINKRIPEQVVVNLFAGLMVVIIGISVFNIAKFT